jgi:hypothetical protein
MSGAGVNLVGTHRALGPAKEQRPPCQESKPCDRGEERGAHGAHGQPDLVFRGLISNEGRGRRSLDSHRWCSLGMTVHFVHGQMCTARPSESSAASPIASESVGWA